MLWHYRVCEWVSSSSLLSPESATWTRVDKLKCSAFRKWNQTHLFKKGKQLTTWQTNDKIYSIDEPVISGLMGKVCHLPLRHVDEFYQRSWSAGLTQICTNSRWGKVYVYAVIRTRWPILTSHLWLGGSTLQTCVQSEPHLTVMMRMMMPKVLTFHNRFRLVICLTLSLTYIFFVILKFALLNNWSSNAFLLWNILILLFSFSLFTGKHMFLIRNTTKNTSYEVTIWLIKLLRNVLCWSWNFHYKQEPILNQSLFIANSTFESDGILSIYYVAKNVASARDS